MLNNLVKTCAKLYGKVVEKLGGLYTNSQVVRFCAVGLSSFTRVVAQFLYSLIRSSFDKSYLLFEVVHTFPTPYNNNYLYKVNRKEV